VLDSFRPVRVGTVASGTSRAVKSTDADVTPGDTHPMQDEPRGVVRRGYDDVAESYLADRTSDGGDVVMLRGLLSRLAPGSSTRVAAPACR
jgi:hypothetical protein